MSEVITYLGSLRAHNANELFPGDMRDTAIFSSYFSGLIWDSGIYLDSLQKIESR
jgi:hypothetical protein